MDQKLFSHIKKIQPKFLLNKLEIKKRSSRPTPIFILGMPRSGTTLLEQIISSHSMVAGGGELDYVKQFGAKLAVGSSPICTSALYRFRKKYLSEISKISNGKSFVTDKMPHNFLYIPLICVALPEAKIIHVKRDPSATCWSNYKNYFPKKGLGYSFDLQDIVSYYNLYDGLMKFYMRVYGDRIYTLNYEQLTIAQLYETRKLIQHLGFDWEKKCLSPHRNKRSVRTLSQQQVRQKLYQGSSEAWKKYEPFLKGVFDSLGSE